MNGRVLIVDDDDWQADHLAQQLRTTGYDVVVSAHAPQALALIDDEQLPDCIVLDIGLPGANGMTLLHELRSHADLAHIPVVVCSNVSVTLDELRPYGVTAFLAKSTINHGDIVTAVRRSVADE